MDTSIHYGVLVMAADMCGPGGDMRWLHRLKIIKTEAMDDG
ncbi:hypothetical protein MNBD_GAMMA17-354 [hydrothermal vent metagenome]|uniref:Uncharacterized protein n=1 Tax=hydrothermal vent metagenome TaxID=652676 RepID=A0A3B1A194_9ZZZZ